MRNRIIALLIFPAALQTGCKQTSKPDEVVYPVTLGEAASAPFREGEARYSAVVLPNREADVSIKAGGYVKWIAQRPSAAGGLRALDAGDLVKAGTLLVRLRAPELAAQLRQARAVVSGAVAAQQESKAQVEQAHAAAQQAEDDWARAQRLYAQAALTKPEYEAVRTRYATTLAQSSQAAAAASTQAANIRSSEARQTEASALLGYTELRAPFSGVVVRRNVTFGSLIAMGQSSFTVAEIDKVRVSFSVPDTKIGNLHFGDLLAVQCEALGSASLPGAVTLLAAGANRQTSMFNVEVTLPNADHNLRPGMIATVSLPSSTPEVRVFTAVPLAAMVHRPDVPGGYGVFTVTTTAGRSVAHLQAVRPGPIEGNDVTIQSGLRPGAVVVVQGSADLLDGQTVRGTADLNTGRGGTL